MPPGIPILAATATVTPTIRDDVIDKLDMKGCKMVCVSPDCPNIYEVRQRSTTDDNLQPIVESLRVERNKANRVIVF